MHACMQAGRQGLFGPLVTCVCMCIRAYVYSCMYAGGQGLFGIIKYPYVMGALLLAIVALVSRIEACMYVCKRM
jgi:hypothetical protein